MDRPPYTRRRLGGRQPLWGMGVTSLIAEISSPAACNERIAASRPAPGPLTHTSTRFMPRLRASRAVASAATCAANGVLLREPLKPTFPALAQVTTAPSVSVIVMIVLLKLACTWATPFAPTLRSRFLVFLTSATRNLRWSPRSPGGARDPVSLSAPPRRRARAGRYRLGGPDLGAAATGFFITPAVFLGPLRVRALVLVRWPRTGSPRR